MKRLKKFLFTFLLVIEPKSKWLLLYASLFLDVVGFIVLPIIWEGQYPLVDQIAVSVLSIPLWIINLGTLLSFFHKQSDIDEFMKSL
jgi:hypothetical protein